MFKGTQVHLATERIDGSRKGGWGPPEGLPRGGRIFTQSFERCDHLKGWGDAS